MDIQATAQRRDAWPKTTNTPGMSRGCSSDEFGGDLLSQGVYPQVPSALAVLTSVFGMGTGVTLPLWPPKSVVKVSRSDLKDSRASTSEFVQ